ncbi:MAG: c-type cytochrome, partial [Maribacter sp.]
MDCKTCHKEAEASIGPNYKDVAMKYKDQRNGLSYLQRKIVAGGSGVWGEVMMPAHPKITSDESRQIAMYIRSLASDGLEQKSLPSKGTITAEPSAPGHMMVITASYTDKGAEGTIPLTGSNSVAIPSNSMKFSEAVGKEGASLMSFNGMNLLLLDKKKGWFSLDGIDMSRLKSVSLTAGWQSAPKISFNFEVHEGSADGPLLGKATMGPQAEGSQGGMVNIPLTGKSSGGSKTIYITYATEEGKDPSTIALMGATFN